MAEHTPGPWTFYDRYDGEGYRHFVIPGEYRDGEVEGGTVPICAVNMKADAWLIAAAPDLLAALEAVADGDSTQGQTCWCHKTDFHEVFCQQARAAIAKAKGGD